MPPGGEYLEELWIGIKADYAHLQAGLKMSQNEIKSFVGHIATSSQQLKKFGRTTTIVSAVVVAFGAVINKVFAKFEQSMANTISVLGATSESIDQLNAAARRMGETTIFSASEAADAMYYLASAGYDANQVMGALKGTLDLAAATQFDLAETTRIVVSTLNAFGLEAAQAGRISNTFSAIISASQATMGKLGDSMKYVAPVMAQLGISVEQTSATLGTLYNSGLEASQAGTYLRQGMIRLQAPTKEAMKAIKNLGLEFNDVNPQMHDMVEIIGAFNKAGAGMIDKGDELAKIFGTRSVNAWQILVKSGAENLTQLTEEITNTNKAAEMAEIQINTFSGAMKLLKSVLQETAIQIGEALQPILRWLVDFLRDAVALFNKMPMGIKTVTVTIIAFAAALGLLVGPMALLLAQLPSLIAMVTGLGVSFQVALGWVGLLSAAVIGITMALGGYIRSQAALNTQVNSVISATKTEQGEFDLLARRYLELKKKITLTTAEKELYLKTIKTLQEKYPNYFKNMDLEKEKFEDAKIAIDNANVSLKDYLNTKIAQAILDDENSKYIEVGKKIAKVQEQLTDSGMKLTQQQAEFNENVKETIDLGNGIKVMVPTLKGLWNSFVGGESGKTMYEDTALSIKSMTGELAKLEAEQNSIYDNITKRQEDVAKLSGLAPKTIIPPVNTDCPEDYHWDDKKGMCVPNNAESSKDAEAEMQLQNAIISIKRKGMEAGLSLLAQNKDKSLEQEKLYLTAKQLLERTDLKNWYDTEKAKLKDMKASKEEMEILETTYASRILDITAKQKEESSNLNEKWAKVDEKNMLNQFNYEADHYADGLENLQGYLAERLSILVGEGKKWTDEYLSILNQMDAIDEEIKRPKQNKMLYDMEIKKREDSKFDSGYSDEYGLQLSKYQDFLQAQLELTVEWSDEYVNILREIEDTKDEMFNNEMEKNRLLFLSMADGANIAASAVAGGFSRMWNFILPKSREAANIMDALWLGIRDSALRAMQQILQDFITQQLMKWIAQIVGFAVGGPGGAALGGVGVDAANAGGFTGSNFGTENYAATGASVVRSGRMKVHAGEVIVPANIVRSNKKEYETASGNKAKTEQPVTNNISFVLNNPVVNDNRYWDEVFETHINPAVDRLNKRLGK